MPLGEITWCQVSNRDRSSNIWVWTLSKTVFKFPVVKTQQKYTRVFKLWGFSPLEKYIYCSYNWIMFPSIGRHKQCRKSPSSAGLALCHRSQRCKVPNGHLGRFKGAGRTRDAQLRYYYDTMVLYTCVDSHILQFDISPPFIQTKPQVTRQSWDYCIFYACSFRFLHATLHTYVTYIQHMHYSGTYVLSKWAAYNIDTP